jgi:undecaprenyl-diphosphatase
LFIVLAILVSPRINPRISETPLERADSYAFLKINDAHYKPFDQFMVLMSQYGREVVWIFTAILLLIFGGWTGRKAAIVMAIAMIVLIALGIVAKEAIGRIRPIIPDADFLMAPDTEYSFPSGHAMIVSAGAAVMFTLFRNSYRKLVVSMALTGEAALVCFSRVYVGGHYPLDVIGGILLGVGVAFIFVAVSKRIDQLLQPIAKVLKR